MRIPLVWLREYVDFDVDAAQLAHDLTMSGTKIEAVHAPAAVLDGVWVGKVQECGRHPNADKLSVCRVDVGGEELHIVCGAPNVRAGLTVAVARVGARLPGNVRIRKSRIRGVESHGMISSARELGLGQEADGILELDPALPVGAPFTAAGADAVLDAEITPNRPDCLGLLGIAREVAALYGTALRLPAVWTGAPKSPPAVRVEIESAEDCPRYLGRTIRSLHTGASPDWMQARLAAMGCDPINNIVDITNYVLFETGQPIHAFDLQALQGGRIVVRRARRGEKLRTLDGIDRDLDPELLVIADAERPVALAGILGGAESAVQEGTRAILLEVAGFHPGRVRSGRRKLGVDTEAAYRFERQTDVESVRWVADRATRLLAELAGGDVREAWEDVYPQPAAPIRIALRCERANRLIGTSLGATEMGGLLRRLELDARVEAERLDVGVPSFRRDLRAEIDLVEEVARVYGYQNIPEDVIPAAPLQPAPNAREALLDRLRALCVGLGYTEVRASAFMDRGDPDRLALAADDVRRRVVRVRNPIVSTLDTLRTTLVPGLLRIVKHNLNRDAESLRLVSIDRVFLDVATAEGLPTESERLVAVACGARGPENWAAPRLPCDLFDLKGDAEALGEQLGVDTVWSRGYTEPFLDSDVSFLISGTYGTIGRGGAVREEVLRGFDVEAPVFLLELDVDALSQHLPGRREFRGIPRFPAVKRDLSLQVPRALAYAEVHAAAIEGGGPLLESVHCFDVFEDRARAEGARSIGLRLRFRSRTGTLTDDVVDRQIDAILRRLAEKDVQLRAV